MKVKIFSTLVGVEHERPKQSIEELEKRVNDFLAQYPSAIVQWLQSTGGAQGANSAHVITVITAVINY